MASISVIIRPPAITLAIWPDTFAPAACISRKFWLYYCRPSLCTTRLAMGKAVMPAAAIMGFT